MTYQKPRALKPGDWVGLVAPSSPFPYEPFNSGIKFLQDQGFRVRYLPDLPSRKKGFLAGEDQQRAEELQLMFQDPEVKAILVVRGGYGAQRILDKLDPKIIQQNPKIFWGYSDATCLLSYFLDVCNLICFHGPVLNELGDLSDRTKRFFLNSLTLSEPLGTIPLENAKWIEKGQAKAPLIGGNLSLLCSSLGTPWEIKTSGRILFLEDWGEKPYKIDRMLVQLRQAGKLSSLAGLLFGDFQENKDGSNHIQDSDAIDEVLFENSRDLGVPVVCGLPVGHGKDNIPLPVGVLGELDGQEGRFAILEAAVTNGKGSKEGGRP